MATPSNASEAPASSAGPQHYAEEPMELEHAMGFAKVRSSLHAIPGTTKYMYLIGGCIVQADSADPHNQSFLRGHDEDVTCFTLSRSGRLMATGQKGHNSDVVVWDFHERRVLHRISEHDGGIEAVDISHDDSIVATVGTDRRITFFDTSNGGMITHMPISHLMQPDDFIRDAAFGGKVQDVKRRDTGGFHFCVCTSQLVLPFHVDPYEPTVAPVKLSLGAFQRRYSAARYSAHGDLLFVGSDSGDMAVFSTVGGTVLTTVRICTLGIREIRVPNNQTDTEVAEQQQNQGGFKYARFGPGSERRTSVFVGGGDGTVAECVVPDHGESRIDVVAKRNVGEDVCSLTVADPSIGRVIVGSVRGTTFSVVCDPLVKNLQEGISTLSNAITNPFNAVTCHPSQPDKFVSASADGIVRMWDLSTYRITGCFLPHAEKVTEGAMTCSSICISDGLEIQLSAWSDGAVRCHDMTNYKLLWTHHRAHRSPITALCVSPSMKYFVTGSEQGEIKIWDIRTRELKGELKDHAKAVVSLQLFDDDRHLASASTDRTVVTWDLVSLRRITSHETHSGPLTSMLLCRNQCNVYTTGMDKRLALWDLRHKEPARVVPYASGSSEAYCTCVRRSSDERLLATGGTDQVVQLWDERLMTGLATGYGHSGTVTDVGFTCDNKQIVSCGQDSAVMVWNVYA